MFQLHHHVLRPLTTAHLAQTMTLLSLTAEELRQQIESELASNPALELVEERRCPTCHRLLPPRGSCPICSCPQIESSEEPVVFISPREDFYPKGDREGVDVPDEGLSASVEDLPTYVLRQIAPELDNEDRYLAAHLLTHLDEDGFITISLMEVARYCHASLSQVEEVQRIIQRADPIGVGSSTPQEALLVQLDVLSDSMPVPPLARDIIQECMELLSRRLYPDIARQLEATISQVKQAVRFISENLNPFPGRSHWGDVHQAGSAQMQVYHQPDILIGFLNDDPSNPLMVEIILPLSGTLRVNPLFRGAVQQASEDKKEAWKSDMERASLFVKCLQQRNHTIQRLMQKVVMLQKNYIIHGEKYLQSITRARISEELEVHESTISRAVANKTVQLPNKKIVPLSSFFDRSLNVRSVLREIISQEERPLSDAELVDLLAGEGFNVARRTVAKYRSMEGILPAHLRTSYASVA